MSEHGELWQGPAPGELLWEAWDTEYAVFCNATGDTHILSELPAEVLRQLTSAPSSTRELATRIAVLYEIDDSEEWQRKVAAVVQNLHQLDLLHKKPA
jgi:PqqD family protein of HPr-rel-A system